MFGPGLELLAVAHLVVVPQPVHRVIRQSVARLRGVFPRFRHGLELAQLRARRQYFCDQLAFVVDLPAFEEQPLQPAAWLQLPN